MGATYRSVRGPIASAWRRRRDGAVAVTVTLPAGTGGRVVLRTTHPAQVTADGARLVEAQDGRAVYAIAAGTWRFVVPR